MNVENKIEADSEADFQVNTGLLRRGLDALDPFVQRVRELETALQTIVDAGDKSAARAAKRLQRQLAKLEPSLTMIGQVKAGKTSLVNSLIGWPDLLPADVNPWTSVVTSIHLSPKAQLGGNRSSFRFFDQAEWTRLLDRGGRIGELAGRAGAEDEIEKVAIQLEAMRDKSIRRLGDKFELLMGQEHKYGYFDHELIERYVCLGDDFETDYETSTTQGRFADITKSAELYMQREEYPFDFCIRDTPGVNDTFMMREQITIRAIRESRMCVVVLSAHQALSTVDMALIRLISNLPSREVTIFVNRIDELSDPVSQVPEIRDSIRKTLKDHQGPVDAEIIFGSAYWANHALKGWIDELSEDSAEALYKWAESELEDGGKDMPAHEMVWQLCGVPRLLQRVSSSIEEGSGGEALTRIAKQALNLVSGLATGDHIEAHEPSASDLPPLDHGQIGAELARIETDALSEFDAAFDAVSDGFVKRLEKSHKSFLDRATASLITNLERFGDTDVWHYDATGLRVLLRSAFQVFARNAQKASKTIYKKTSDDIREVYLRAFGMSDASFQLEPPPVPHVAAPVLLGQTIALDLSSTWWSRWWRRRKGYANFATAFAEIIKAETDPIVEDMRVEHVAAVRRDARRALTDFIAAQREMLDGLVSRAAGGKADLSVLDGGIDPSARAASLTRTRTILQSYVEDQTETAA
ncbi:dynamin family protein [Ovoidimarina sediminis]|uniref:dynamin family protein n=1 Tax=Ovoidimarina sediminis TaxID=3079856 RepID=UPI002906BA4F|nr:dynamin family protein [Rhodophyticola sp. MJ-SS7]MDU8943350.1 dynamin family protein [Rhodophyticola sp. MJ-SS7]